MNAWRTLRECCSVIRSGYWGEVEATTERPMQVRVVRNGDIGNHGEIRSYAPRWFGHREAESSRVERGDVLLTTSGDIGKVALAPDDTLNASNFVRILRPRASLVDGEWLFWGLQAPRSRAAMARNTGASTIANLSAGFFDEPILPVVPLAEQRMIAKMLSRQFHALREAQTGDIARTKATRLLLKAVETRAIRQQGDNWPTTRLRDLASTISKGTTPMTMGHAYVPSGIPFLRAEDVVDGADGSRATRHIDAGTNQVLARSKLLPGDVLVTIAGTLGRVGYVGPTAPAMNCNQAVAFVRLDQTRAMPAFAAAAIRQSVSAQLIAALGSGGSIQNLSLDQVGNIVVALPPLSVQAEIVNGISNQRTQVELIAAGVSAQSAELELADRLILSRTFGDTVAAPQ